MVRERLLALHGEHERRVIQGPYHELAVLLDVLGRPWRLGTFGPTAHPTRPSMVCDGADAERRHEPESLVDVGAQPVDLPGEVVDSRRLAFETGKRVRVGQRE